MDCCNYCLYRVFGANPDSVINKDGYLLAQDRVVYQPERLDSLPFAVQVTFKPVTLRRDPRYPGTKLGYSVPVGTFLKPLEKVFFQYEGVQITFFRVEFRPHDNRQSLVCGWLLDYSPGCKQYVLHVVRSRQGMSGMERSALEMATAVPKVPGGRWFRGNPRPDRLPDKIRVIGKTLAVRESPQYPGKKQEFGFDVGDILKPLEHKIVINKTAHAKLFVSSNENAVINFYRVEFNRRQQGWLLDYSPGNDTRTLEIFYR